MIPHSEAIEKFQAEAERTTEIKFGFDDDFTKSGTACLTISRYWKMPHSNGITLEAAIYGEDAVKFNEAILFALSTAQEKGRREGEAKRDEAYEAFHWLQDNHEWAVSSLDVWMSKVDPKTRIRSDKEVENTRHEYWLEGGPFSDEVGAYSHDLELDCGGGSFEEAIIEYAKLVKKQYGEKTKLNGSAAQSLNQKV